MNRGVKEPADKERVSYPFPVSLISVYHQPLSSLVTYGDTHVNIIFEHQAEARSMFSNTTLRT